LAVQASPCVTGFAAGQQLTVKWNGDAFDNNQNTGLLLAAALSPHEVSELVMAAVVRAQPLSASEHAARRSELEQRIGELCYVEAQLVEEGDGEHGVEAPPWCVLGVRIGEASEGEAAA
jgi:hypothetical protein